MTLTKEAYKDSLNNTSLLSYGNELMDSIRPGDKKARPLSSILDIPQTVLHLKQPEHPQNDCSFPSTPRTVQGIFSPTQKSKEYTLKSHATEKNLELEKLRAENSDLKLKNRQLETALAASDALAKQYLQDCQKLKADLDESKRQYAGQCHLLKDTYLEIQRLDQEVKNLQVDTKQREERKDRLIEQLKDTIETLKSE